MGKKNEKERLEVTKVSLSFWALEHYLRLIPGEGRLL